MDSSFSLTRTLKSFEGEWESSPPASIDAHVEAVSADRRVTLLQELICIDMEFRWRNQSGSAIQATQSLRSDATIPVLSVEDYLRTYPELGNPDTVDVLLVEEEFRVRTQWDAPPDVDEFLKRFPRPADTLRDRLAAIRDQSAGETPTDKHEESVDVELFMSRLETCQLYSSEHWDNLKQRLKLAGPFDSGQTVGEWLISHGELKTGQLQILLKGSSCPLVLGSYEVLEELGAGGMGQVYRALHREMLREVAIKTLKNVAAIRLSGFSVRFRQQHGWFIPMSWSLMMPARRPACGIWRWKLSKELISVQ